MDIIKHLDELRAKATQGEWQQYPDGANIHMEDRCGIVSRDDWKWAERPKNYVAMSWNDKGAMDLNDAAYIIALHNAFPALRQAVLERDRYKAAGEALAKAVEKMSGTKIDGGGHLELFVERKDARDALAAYRTAIDDSSK